MEPEAGGLRFVDRIRAASEVHEGRLHPEARRLAIPAIGAALALHAAAGFVTLPRVAPSAAPPIAPARPEPAVVHAVVPLSPPRRVETLPPRPQAPVEAAPAADPAAPAPLVVEPWLEPGRETEFASLPAEAARPLGVPEPPAAGPAAVEQGAVTNPVLIPSSRVQPVYPQRALHRGIPGSVMLDVSVMPDGTVGDIAVLRCEPPDQGFCESAMRAVKHWRYMPGFVGEKPAQVSVKVSLEFKP